MFPTSDGHINIAASSARLFERFSNAIGHPEWVDKAGWTNQKGRSANRQAINAAISAVTATRPAAHWIELFEGAGIPCGPINSIDQVFADPQVKHLGMATPVEHRRLGHLELVASPVNMSGIARGVRTATPERSEHTESVLRDLGYDDETIAALAEKGVI